jgi:Deacetylase PdaC
MMKNIAIFALPLAFFPVALAAQASATAEITKENTADYEFSFGYPAEVTKIPKLKAEFDAEVKKEKAYFIKSAAEAKADATKNDYPYNPHQSGTAWEVAADTKQILSLAGYYSSYSGGAHGNYGFGSRIWDKKKARLLKNSTDIFAKPKDALASIRQDYCNGLNVERRKKLGADWKPEEDSIFSSCPEFSELAIVFMGEKGKPANRILLIAGPYIAGSYAEGEYEVELPITPKLIAMIKPEYRVSFVPRVRGP